MVFNNFLKSKLYQIQNGIQTNSHQLWKGVGSEAHCNDLICVVPSLLYGRSIFFLKVSQPFCNCLSESFIAIRHRICLQK